MLLARIAILSRLHVLLLIRSVCIDTVELEQVEQNRSRPEQTFLALACWSPLVGQRSLCNFVGNIRSADNSCIKLHFCTLKI